MYWFGKATSFQHTAARRRLVFRRFIFCRLYKVSTHSRPKTAGGGLDKGTSFVQFQHTAARRRLIREYLPLPSYSWFQHTAARRRLEQWQFYPHPVHQVSTHSRPKAAGHDFMRVLQRRDKFQHTAARRRLEVFYTASHTLAVSFNTQPPEGGWVVKWCFIATIALVSTHSRPKAAGRVQRQQESAVAGFNTQPPEGGWSQLVQAYGREGAFQHTAARRRLAMVMSSVRARLSFNTQPPEGGWFAWFRYPSHTGLVSTHSRPKAAGLAVKFAGVFDFVSTHSRPKAAGRTISQPL